MLKGFEPSYLGLEVCDSGLSIYGLRCRGENSE